MDLSRNVVIIPSRRVIDEALGLSSLISRLAAEQGSQNEIVLSQPEGRWPHLSLYQFGLPRRNEDELKETLAQIAARTRSFVVTLEGYSIYRGAMIFWMARKLDFSLQHLHESLIHEMNDLREGVILEQFYPLLASSSGLTKEQRIMLGRFGYPTALDSYEPHITIGQVKNAQQVIKELPDYSVECEVDELHLTEIGPHGTCPGSIESFRLQ